MPNESSGTTDEITETKLQSTPKPAPVVTVTEENIERGYSTNVTLTSVTPVVDEF
jgi:hypothetical protein